MTTIFISDLHLEANRPAIGEQFISLLRGEARGVEALYILGDLFEAWLGDDDPNPYYASLKSEISTLVDSGVPVWFMHGNRDFMIGADFARETGVQLLDEEVVVDLYGEKVLLSHGDAYCTDDLQYQQVRKMTRNPEWQSMMRAKSIQERIAFALQAREQSMAHGMTLQDEISDVNQSAVEAAMQKHNVRTLLHGHTHRPAIHEFSLRGESARRIVLGDWYEQGSIVRWTDAGAELQAMPRAAVRSESENPDPGH